MNLKKNFRAVLTTLGIGSLVYAAILFSSTSGSNQDVKSLIIYGILDLLHIGYAWLQQLRMKQDSTIYLFLVV
jgi:hypothetical protein